VRAIAGVYAMHKGLLLLLFAVLLTGCASTAYVNGLHREQNGNAQEYAVYDAVIQAMYIDNETEVIVVEDHTLPLDLISEEWSEAVEYINENLPDAAEITLHDFQSKNQQPHRLETVFRLSIRYVLISEMESIAASRAGWLDFYAKYPKAQGIMRLSRVGFNHDMSQALVYVQNQRSYNIGEGFYVLLTKQRNGWAIKAKFQWMVS
jgi:hypothetical protein